jgi:hypothetical protein
MHSQVNNTPIPKWENPIAKYHKKFKYFSKNTLDSRQPAESYFMPKDRYADGLRGL